MSERWPADRRSRDRAEVTFEAAPWTNHRLASGSPVEPEIALLMNLIQRGVVLQGAAEGVPSPRAIRVSGAPTTRDDLERICTVHGALADVLSVPDERFGDDVRMARGAFLREQVPTCPCCESITCPECQQHANWIFRLERVDGWLVRGFRCGMGCGRFAVHWDPGVDWDHSDLRHR